MCHHSSYPRLYEPVTAANPNLYWKHFQVYLWPTGSCGISWCTGPCGVGCTLLCWSICWICHWVDVCALTVGPFWLTVLKYSDWWRCNRVWCLHRQFETVQLLGNIHPLAIWNRPKQLSHRRLFLSKPLRDSWFMTKNPSHSDELCTVSKPDITENHYLGVRLPDVEQKFQPLSVAVC